MSNDKGIEFIYDNVQKLDLYEEHFYIVYNSIFYGVEGIEKVLRTVKFTESIKEDDEEVIKGSYNFNDRMITITVDIIHKMTKYMRHELYHVDFALKNSHLLEKCTFKQKIAYDLLNEYYSYLKNGIYVCKNEISLYKLEEIDREVKELVHTAKQEQLDTYGIKIVAEECKKRYAELPDDVKIKISEKEFTNQITLKFINDKVYHRAKYLGLNKMLSLVIRKMGLEEINNLEKSPLELKIEELNLEKLSLEDLAEVSVIM